MFFKLLKLELKSAFRSPQFAVNLFSKIAMLLVFGYFALLFLGGAFAVYFGSIEEGEDPLRIFSKYFIVFWVVDILLKYTLQQMPTQNIKPLLTQYISKNTIVGLTIAKISFSFLTWGFLLYIIPFSILLATDTDYATFGVVSVALFTLSVILINALVNIIINKNSKILIALFGTIIIAGILQYFNYLNFFSYSELVLLGIYQHPFLTLIPIVILTVFSNFIFHFIKRNLYLDKGLELKKTIGKTETIAYLNRFGTLGVFINNDIRMIKRSKMARSAALGGIFFLLYGLMYFMPGYQNPFMQVFLGIFTTGGFMFTFGQRVPAWDSSYYPLMMTQNIPYLQYLKAKWALTAITIVIAMVLSLGYLWVSWEFYLTIFAAGMYNLGFNSYITLLSGAYNKKAIDLNTATKAFSSGQNNFNPKLLLMLLPQLALPIIVFGLLKLLWGIIPAVIGLGILGLLGFLFRNKIFSLIVKVYHSEKYSTIAAFKQN